MNILVLTFLHIQPMKHTDNYNWQMRQVYNFKLNVNHCAKNQGSSPPCQQLVIVPELCTAWLRPVTQNAAVSSQHSTWKQLARREIHISCCHFWEFPT